MRMQPLIYLFFQLDNSIKSNSYDHLVNRNKITVKSKTNGQRQINFKLIQIETNWQFVSIISNWFWKKKSFTGNLANVSFRRHNIYIM
jgi:hypothetical protein